jgi:hypothetical protein
MLLAVASAVSVFAPVVSADEPTFQPDAWIRRSGGSAYGRDFRGTSSTEITDTIRIRVLTNGAAEPWTYYSRKYIFSAQGGGVPDAARMWVKRV